MNNEKPYKTIITDEDDDGCYEIEFYLYYTRIVFYEYINGEKREQSSCAHDNSIIRLIAEELIC